MAANNIPGIDFKKGANPTIDSETADYEIPFYKGEEYFSGMDEFEKFVKHVETKVRTSEEYRQYIAILKEDYGLRRCQILGNITDEDGENILEMHHGPLFTLYDTVVIMLEHLLYMGKELTSFSMTDLVIQEHFNHNIQVMMVTETAHEQIHNRQVFVNINQGFGDIHTFIQKYCYGFSRDKVGKIIDYLVQCKHYESFDNNILKLHGFVKNWNADNSIN